MKKEEYGKKEFDAELEGLRCTMNLVTSAIIEGVNNDTAANLPSAMYFLSRKMEEIYEKGNAILWNNDKGVNENE